MYVYIHVIASLILSILLFPFFGYKVILIFFSGFMFDVDHYLYYMLKFKDFSFLKAYYYMLRREYLKHGVKDMLHIFHTVEFYLLLLVISLFYNIFLYIFIGVMFHAFLDIILKVKCVYISKRNDLRGLRADSLVMWIIRRIYPPSNSTRQKHLRG